MTLPVITIDGPSASGKGTLARLLAEALGFHYLDSGAIYRALAWWARAQGVTTQDATRLAELAPHLPLAFKRDRIWIAAHDVTDALRTEPIGKAASELAAHPAVRQALLQRQLEFRRPPGLVADGRDMGTVVFPDARLKVFLTASVEARTARRLEQLQRAPAQTTAPTETPNLVASSLPGNRAAARIERSPASVAMPMQGALVHEAIPLPALREQIRADLQTRDTRDSQRSTGALRAAADARNFDNSALDVPSSLAVLLEWWQQVQSLPDAPQQV